MNGRLAIVGLLLTTAVSAILVGGEPLRRSRGHRRPAAASQRAVIVSGDIHLTALSDRIPVRKPADFLAEVEGTEAAPG